MSQFKKLVGKSITKDVAFMGEKVTVKKLTVNQVLDIQAQAKENQENPSTSELAGFELLKNVISMSVDGANDLSDEDFKTFPMEELNKLSNEILKFSGLDTGKQD